MIKAPIKLNEFGLIPEIPVRVRFFFAKLTSKFSKKVVEKP